MSLISKFFVYLIFLFFLNFHSYSKEIKIQGLERLNNSDIQSLLTSDLSNKDYNEKLINTLIKELYAHDQIYDVSYTEYDNFFLINIYESPIVENIFFNGNIQIKDDDLKNFLNTKTNYFLNKNLISKDISLIKNIYLTKGYENISVNVATEKFSKTKVNLIFDILEGDPNKIDKISFYGNKTFNSRFLSTKILSKSTSFYNFLTSGSNTSQSVFSSDKAAILNFYKQKGFFNADVTFRIYKNNFNTSILEFYVKENERFKISNINFSDNKIISSLESYQILINNFNKLILKNDNYFDFQLLEDLISDLNDLAAKNSINLTFDYSINNNLSLKEVSIKITDSPTVLKSINDIKFYGNSITKNDVLLSKIDIKPGDYINEKKLKSAKQDLTNLKYINEVSYTIVDDNNKSDIIFDINENKKTGNLLLGGSFTGDVGLGFLFSIKDYNIFGSGNEINAEFSINAEEAQFDIIYIAPSKLNKSLSNKYMLKNKETDYTDSFGYKAREQSIGYFLTFDYSDKIKSSIGYKFDKTEGFSPINQTNLSITDNIGDFYNSNFSFVISHNDTNDFLYPSDGSSNKISIEYSPKNISDNSYYKLKYDGDIYYNLSQNNNYLFMSNQIGIADSFNNKLKTIDAFSLGGLNFKGFDYRGVGPKINNIYLGGNKFFTSTIGYGTKFLFDQKDNFYLRYFYSMGSIWDSDYTDENDFNLRSSAGVTFDVLSPVGPISFSYAVPIQKKDNDINRNFNFTIGTSF